MRTGDRYGKTSVLRIEGEMTISRASELKCSLFKIIEECSNLELDLADVTTIDITGVQLIMLSKVLAESKGGALLLANSSPSVLDVVALLGLSDYFRETMPPPPVHNFYLPHKPSREVMYAD